MRYIVLLFAICLYLPNIHAANAANAAGVAVLRDCEIESLLLDAVRPILHDNNIDTKSLRVVILDDDSFNAFVMNGSDIYINSGLLMRAGKIDAVIGVMLHEMSHVMLGHVTRIGEQISNASKAVLMTSALGMLMVVAGGGGGSATDLGAAMIFAGEHIATRNVLSYSRMQELAADMNALQYMVHAGYYPGGLLNAMQRIKELEDDFHVDSSAQSPYATTHPNVKSRIAYLDKRIKDYKADPAKYKNFDEYAQRYERAIIKLRAFAGVRAEVKLEHSGSSCADKYAMAILGLRDGSYEHSHKLMLDVERNCYSGDPYIYELLGQISYGLHRYEESVDYYNRALAMVDSNLITMELIAALVEIGDDSSVKKALHLLHTMEEKDRENPSLWYYMAKAYSAINDQVNSYCALLEYSIVIGDRERIETYIRALSILANTNDRKVYDLIRKARFVIKGR